ncbi:MAG: putative transcriptional regulator with domain [Bacteroidota bacterium]|jgi:ATP-dependent DNA helicase RecG|nr:putative transcriptional regulator with domain [Bacteroidota bacterium]
MAKKTTKKIEGFDPKKYMKLAVDVMRKSIAEKRTDGKVNPKVGAVLVFPDGTYETAHRGEVREGNHAEYVLIERKCISKDLKDAVLFSTLEPCVKRSPPKRGCCTHVTSARIKTIYVGIEDPDPTVAGEGIRYMEEKGVKVIMFDREFQKQIEQVNAAFLKQATHRAKVAKTETKVSEFKKSIPRADISQFSQEALSKFIEEAKLKYKPKDKAFQSFLADIGVMHFDEKANIYRPTGMGILLFGENPRAKFKQAALMAHVDYGDYKIEPATFDQPLVLIPDLVEEWLKKVLPLSKDTSGFKRKDIPDFPIDVLREVIINAIVHRDYSIEGAKSALEIDNDKIIVKSPGAPMPSISLDQLNTFQAPSVSRNPIITYVFGLMDYVEEKGFGMKALRSLNDKFKLPLPEYEMKNPFLTLTFPRTLEAVKRVSHHTAIKELNNDELAGYEWVKSKGEATKKGYAKHFGYEERKASRHLSKMRTLKLLGDNGEKLNSPNFKYIAK